MFRLPYKNNDNSGSTGEAPSSSGWVRHAEWLPMPEIAEGEECFYLLTEIAGPYIDIDFIVSEGYSVDWGDGTPVENFASYEKATHRYIYSEILVDPLSYKPVKQVMIKITGAGIKTLNLSSFTNTPFKEVKGKCTTLESLSCESTDIEKFELIGVNALLSLASAFSACRRLKEVIIDTTTVTTFNQCFDGCYLLEEMPDFITVNATDFSKMFEYCYSLHKTRDYNTTNATTIQSMFTTCQSLTRTPVLTAPSLNSNSSMLIYRDNNNLVEIPRLDFSSYYTNVTYLTFNCPRLKKVGVVGPIRKSVDLSRTGLDSREALLSFLNEIVLENVQNVLTLPTGSISLLTQADIDTALSKDWTIAE